MTRAILPLALAGALGLSPQPDCNFATASPWIGTWLSAWTFTSREVLRLPDAPPPEFVFFDDVCVYTTAPETSDGPVSKLGPPLNGTPLPWRTSPHDGTITLPDSARVPVQLMSFTAPKGDRGSFFVMAAPDYWAQAGVDSAEVGRDRLITGVFLHEFAHTRQIAGLQSAVAPIEKAWPFPEEVNDDVVQDRFGPDPAYLAAYMRERDLLYEAAAAPAAADARRLAADALRLMRARHERFFTGENAVFRTLDDVFLAFEGAGQWVAFAWLAHPQGGGVPRDQALTGMRRGGRQWSQDEGLALFLVIDRLLPGWPALVFDQGIGGITLLGRALKN